MKRGLVAVIAAGLSAMSWGKVEWQVVGPEKGVGVSSFKKILAEQTGTASVKKAGAETLVLHLGEDDFVKSLKLDLTTLHPYGYYLAKRGNDIALVGRRSVGTGYACFDFLKRYTGYRSFGGAFGEIVPKVEKLDLPESFTFREEPDVPSVYIAGADGANGAFTRNSRLTCRATHAMSHMVTKEMYAEHPEYFALIDGVRKKPGTGAWNPCVTNPDMPELFRQYARRFFAKEPDALGIPMGVNDGGGDCNCEKCLALWEKHGNQYVEFYNTAARILAEEYPGKYLAFIAYSVRCSNPPKDGLRLEPNILVEVTGYANTHETWQKAGVKNFGTYEYLYGLSGSRMAPACYTHFVADYLRNHVRKYGMKTFWEEYFCASPLFDAGRQYVVNELLWNMDADVDALLDDYHAKMYGPAAQAMRTFSDVCEEAFVDNPERKYFQMEYHRPLQFNGYTFERLSRADAALAEAEKAARGNVAAAKRVTAVARLWQAMRPLMDNWQAARALAKADDPDEIIRLAERGLEDIAAFNAFQLAPDEEEYVFLNPKKTGFAKWKSQTHGPFDPRVPLEKAIDAAFERLVGKLGRESARTFFQELADSPTLGAYAATRLTLMGGEPANQIENGSFEETCPPVKRTDGDADWLALGQKGGWVWWKFPSSQARAFTDDAEAHTGTRCMALAENVHGCAVINRWKVEPLTRYRLKVWAKRSDDNGGKELGGFSVRLKGADGKWLDAGSAIGCKLSPESVGRWAEYQVIFTTPDRDDVSIVAIFGAPRQNADQRLWYDDVRLEKLCRMPRPEPAQVACARKTVAPWVKRWGVKLPKLNIDGTLGTKGAYRAEKTADGVVLHGDAEGLRIGLYAWARACGVRWFSPAEEIVVPAKAEPVSEAFFRLHVPSFPYRALHVCGCKDHFDPTVGRWMSFMGMNRRLDSLGEALRNAHAFDGLGLVSDTTVHSYSTLVPQDKYFKEHPEYFALLGGKRAAHGGQLCLSNAGLRETFVRELKEWLARQPNVSPAGICPNDGYGWCECEACRALDTEEDQKNGTVNGRVADFVRFVCAALPDKTIGHYSYSNFADFYKHIDPLPKNLTLSFTAFHCQSHALCDETCPVNAVFRRRIRELKAKGAAFYLYDYYQYNWGVLPAPMWQVVGRDFRSLKKEGLSGFLSEASPAANKVWASYWPAYYTAATLLLEVETDVDALVEDWCRVRYGNAAKPMLGYFREWEQGLDGSWCWTKKPEQYKRLFRPGAERFLDEARRIEPENAAVRRAGEQYAWWKENLRIRENYPVVRTVTVTETPMSVPLHFVNASTQVPDLTNDVKVTLSAKDGTVRFRLHAGETNMGALKVGASPYDGDGFEIFFADGRNNGTSYHFIVDTEAKIAAAESLKTRWNWSWEHHASAHVEKGPDAWTLDFSLPLTDVHAEKEFAFTLIRNRYAGGKWQITGAPAGGAFFKTENYIKAKVR